MKAMILAAGEGSRLRPLTLDRPKPMLPVAESPMLEYTIAWLRHYGVTQIAINLHHCPQIVTSHFGDGSGFGVEITYSLEETVLGTAGGVKRLDHFLDSTFVIIYGDILTDLDLKALVKFHFRQVKEPHLTMTLHRVSSPWECGIVSLDGHGRVTRFVEKPARTEVFSDLASASVLVVDPEILAYVADGCFCDFGRDLFPELIRYQVPIYGWLLPDTAYLIDIGTPEKYVRVQQEWPTQRALRFLRNRVET